MVSHFELIARFIMRALVVSMYLVIDQLLTAHTNTYTIYQPILDLVSTTQLCSSPGACGLHWSEGQYVPNVCNNVLEGKTVRFCALLLVSVQQE